MDDNNNIIDDIITDISYEDFGKMSRIACYQLINVHIFDTLICRFLFFLEF